MFSRIKVYKMKKMNNLYVNNLSSLLALVFLILSLRSDGYIPFPKTWTYEAYLFVLFFSYRFFCFFLLSIIVDKKVKRSLYNSHNSIIFICIFFHIFIFFQAVLQSNRMQELGYSLPIGGWVVVCLLSMTICTYSLVSKYRSSFQFSMVLLGCCLLKLYIIEYFPLNPLRSDMFEIIKNALRLFISGQQPYTYVTDTSVWLSYFPGTWLAFIPAELFGFDYRLMSLVYFILSMMGFYKLSVELNLSQNITKIALPFILMPYWHFRHDIYMDGFYVSIVWMAYYLQRGKFYKASFVIGISLGYIQWSWFSFPLIFAYLFRKLSFKKALKCSLISLVICSLMLVPFFVWNFDAFWFGVVSQIQNTLKDILHPMSAFNLAPYLYYFSLHRFISLIQISSLFISFCWILIKKSNLESLFKICFLVYFFCVLINYHMMTYYYIGCFYYLLIYILYKLHNIYEKHMQIGNK